MQPVRRTKDPNRKRGDGKRTRLEPNHRCWVCDHREEIRTSTSRVWRWAREDPYLGCDYHKRLGILPP